MSKIAGLGFWAMVLLVATGFSSAQAAVTPVSITGEVIDTFCYVTMGARGEGHRQCGLECAKQGIPVGLLQKGTNKIYVLLPSKNGTALPQDVINKMGSTTTVTGHAYSKGGEDFLTVDSVK